MQGELRFDEDCLRQALALLDQGVELADLPDRLLFALAPQRNISAFIQAWIANQRNESSEVPE